MKLALQRQIPLSLGLEFPLCEPCTRLRTLSLEGLSLRAHPLPSSQWSLHPVARGILISLPRTTEIWYMRESGFFCRLELLSGSQKALKVKT